MSMLQRTAQNHPHQLYDAVRLVSENLRQNDKAAATTTAQNRIADVNHYTRLLAAELKWGVSTGALNALQSLGADPGSVATGTDVT
jgi:hypothetical protein